MSDRKFFKKQTPQSRVKTEIVVKYFEAWANVILNSCSRNIAYVDLFSGPGRYDDGTPSTPVLIIEKAIEKEELRQRLIPYFNDEDQTCILDLKKEIRKIPNVELLKNKPRFQNDEVGDWAVDLMQNMKDIPSLSFIDPCGYKGLSRKLLGSSIDGWGRDCIFFFNYNRVNPAISNPLVFDHMAEFFGNERAEILRGKIEEKSASERETMIIEELQTELKGIGAEFFLPFCFKKETEKTSHYIVFISKHFKGYNIMKGIMANSSSEFDHGVPSFENKQGPKQGRLDFENPIETLAQNLLEVFAGGGNHYG